MARSMVAPGVIIVICLFLFWQTASMRSAYAADELFGPAFFPRVVLGGLLVVSVMQMVQQLARRAAAAEETPPPMDAAAFAVTLAAAAAYVWAMQYVGFVPATLIFQAALLAGVFGVRTARGIVLLPTILTGVYFVIFLRLLELPLPQGYGPFRALSRLIYY